MQDAEGLLVLLDYDGTLVPYTATPELARPDPSLLELLAALAGRPNTELHVVSGRARETLEQWLGMLPIALHAEHGFWSRAVGQAEWIPAGELGPAWREPALAILREITARTPGSLIEEKSVALAWHYRMADQESGARRANELRLHLGQMLSNQPVEILAGHKVIEIRPYGIHKGRIVPPLSPERLASIVILAIGDDRTDEDLFTVLPPDAITIKVGPGATHARFRLEGVPAVRTFLSSLVRRRSQDRSSASRAFGSLRNRALGTLCLLRGARPAHPVSDRHCRRRSGLEPGACKPAVWLVQRFAVPDPGGGWVAGRQASRGQPDAGRRWRPHLPRLFHSRPQHRIGFLWRAVPRHHGDRVLQAQRVHHGRAALLTARCSP